MNHKIICHILWATQNYPRDIQSNIIRLAIEQKNKQTHDLQRLFDAFETSKRQDKYIHQFHSLLNVFRYLYFEKPFYLFYAYRVGKNNLQIIRNKLTQVIAYRDHNKIFKLKTDVLDKLNAFINDYCRKNKVPYTKEVTIPFCQDLDYCRYC